MAASDFRIKSFDYDAGRGRHNLVLEREVFTLDDNAAMTEAADIINQFSDSMTNVEIVTVKKAMTSSFTYGPPSSGA